MDARIRPEPADDERRAILAALEALEREHAGGAPSRWREVAAIEATTAAEPPRDPRAE